MVDDELTRSSIENTSVEEFFYDVASCVEIQLKDWDKDFHVYIVKLADYNLVVKHGPKNYNVNLNEEEMESLQKRGGNALHQEIWRQLKKQGLPPKNVSGAI